MKRLLVLFFILIITKVNAQLRITNCPDEIIYIGYYYDFEYAIPCDQVENKYTLETRSHLRKSRGRVWKNDNQNPTICTCKFTHFYPHAGYQDSTIVIKLFKNEVLEDSLVLPVKKATAHLFLTHNTLGNIEVKDSIITLSKKDLRSLQSFMVHPKIKGRKTARVIGYSWKYWRKQDGKTFEGRIRGYKIHNRDNATELQFSDLIRNSELGDKVEFYRIFADMLETDSDMWFLKVQIKVLP